MMEQFPRYSSLQRQRFRFRRFSRAGWAAFRSLSLVVEIGTLASYIADRQLRKSHAAIRQWLAGLSFTALQDVADEADGLTPQNPTVLEQLQASFLLVRQDGVAASRRSVFVLNHCHVVPFDMGRLFLCL